MTPMRLAQTTPGDMGGGSAVRSCSRRFHRDRVPAAQQLEDQAGAGPPLADDVGKLIVAPAIGGTTTSRAGRPLPLERLAAVFEELWRPSRGSSSRAGRRTL